MMAPSTLHAAPGTLNYRAHSVLSVSAVAMDHSKSQVPPFLLERGNRPVGLTVFGGK